MSIIYLKGCLVIIILLFIIGAAAAVYGVFFDKRQINSLNAGPEMSRYFSQKSFKISLRIN